MMKYILFLVICSTLFVSSFAQSSFEKVIGSEENEIIKEVSRNPEGNYIMVGANSGGTSDSLFNYILEIDLYGNLLNKKVFPAESGYNQVLHKIFCVDGGYHLFGTSVSSDTSSFLIYTSIGEHFETI